MYASIQRTIFEANRVSPANAEAGFASFIATIENHNAKVTLGIYFTWAVNLVHHLEDMDRYGFVSSPSCPNINLGQ
jgi:hypothetical protein